MRSENLNEWRRGVENEEKALQPGYKGAGYEGAGDR